MVGCVHRLAESFLLVYAGLFPIVNPVGSAPIFLALTCNLRDAERRALPRRVAVNGFLLLLGSLLVGSHLLEFFGITLPVLRIAGGLAVSSFGWRLLRDGVEPSHDPERAAEAAAVDAFYPLTMPLTVGPGSIAVAITLGSQRPAGTIDATHVAMVAVGAVLGLAAIAASVYVCYRYAERIVGVLGENGTHVLVRLSAFILLCIGISIIWSGVSALMLLPR
jgi:multiple antibiotic resistance protein